MTVAVLRGRDRQVSKTVLSSPSSQYTEGHRHVKTGVSQKPRIGPPVGQSKGQSGQFYWRRGKGRASKGSVRERHSSETER